MKALWFVVMAACGSSASHSPDAPPLIDTAVDGCDGVIDCAGTCNGSATIDCSGTCGTRTVDNCGVCDADPTNDCKWPDSTTDFCSTGTAIVTCPSNPAGQDSDYHIHVPTFVVTTATVTDPITALQWQRTPPYTAITQAAATTYCDNLSLAGNDDWRVPTRLELVSLDDDGNVTPPLDHTAFPGVPQSMDFWTSTPVAGAATYFWEINTNYPSVGESLGTASTAMIVRCVRGPAFTGTLTTVADTVFDSRTNLFWQSAIASTTMVWSDALAYCEGLTLDTYSDWRLPSNKELASIVDDTQTNPAISTLFSMRPSTQFWSSSPCANFTNEGYAVDFTTGSSNTASAFTSLYSVRCVRSN